MGLFSKPKVQYAGEVDVGNSMGETFSLNNRYFQDAQNYTSRVNEAAQQQAIDLLEQAMPGISKVRGRLMQQLNEDLNTKGLPKEVEENLARKAAEMGVTRGTGNSDFSKFSALRDLGIEHTKMVEFRRRMAMSSMQQLFQATPKINPMSPASMLLTPGTTLQVQGQNLDRRQAFLNAKAQAEAQHKAGIMNAIAGVAGFALGGPLGGMLGKGLKSGVGKIFGGGGGTPSVSPSVGQGTVMAPPSGGWNQTLENTLYGP